MIVYIVTSQEDYESREIEDVFSNLQSAEEYVRQMSGNADWHHGGAVARKGRTTWCVDEFVVRNDAEI